MKKWSALFALIGLLFFPSVCFANDMRDAWQTLYPTQDTAVDSEAPDTNFGRLSLTARKQSNIITKRSFVQFDLKTIPQDAVITKAGVSVDIYNTHDAFNLINFPTSLGVVPLSNTWSEYSTTWRNQPTRNSTSYVEMTTTSHYENQTGLWEADITGLARDWLKNTKPNYGLAIDPVKEAKSGSNTGYYEREFDSRESSDSRLRPTLTVFYTLSKDLPTISNVKALKISSTSTKLTWDTDWYANSWVDYGTTNTFPNGSGYEKYAGQEDFTKNHSVTLTNLRSGTLYHFIIKSAHIVGRGSDYFYARTVDATFTAGVDPSPMVITLLSPTPRGIISKIHTFVPFIGQGNDGGASASAQASTPTPSAQAQTNPSTTPVQQGASPTTHANVSQTNPTQSLAPALPISEATATAGVQKPPVGTIHSVTDLMSLPTLFAGSTTDKAIGIVMVLATFVILIFAVRYLSRYLKKKMLQNNQKR